VLWVDDEVRADDPMVRLLELEGFSVDVIQTGAAGIASALTHRHAAIVLDLRLPDMDGLDVLKRLSAGAAMTPVMILSGFLDVERAGTATRLGARDIRSKPLVADDLIEAVRVLVRHARASQPSARATVPRLSREVGVQARLSRTALDLTRQDLSAADFLLILNQFRRLASHLTVSRSRDHDDAQHPDEAPHLLDAVLFEIEQGVRSHQMSSIEAVAERVSACAGDVSAVLEWFLPGGFCACRRALRLRPALASVAFSSEHYAQIAYQHGYEHPAQFTRDFHAAFGLSPHAFRALAETAAAK
jgi:DNA-binding response OmpR family regulator